MEKRMTLKDTFSIHGTDLDDFRSIMREISQATHYRKTSTAEITILAKGYGTKSGNYRVYPIDKTQVGLFDDFFALDESAERSISASDDDAELLRETMERVGFLIEEKGELFFISENALSSIFQRANSNGDSMFRITNARNIFLAESLYKAGIGEMSRDKHVYRSRSDNDHNCTLVYREVTTPAKKALRKIFFVPTEKYSPVPLTILSDLAETICDEDKLGRPEVKGWYTDHEISEIVIVFPEAADDIQSAYKLKDKILPGVMIRSSDTGKACIDIKSVAFVNKSDHYVIIETSKRKHSGAIETNKLVEDADELMLRNVKILPELLAELMLHQVYEGDLNTKKGSKDNQRAVESAINKVIKKTHLVKIIGKKREIALKEALFAEINPEIPYTEYDIAMMIMTCGDRISGIPTSMMDSFAETCAQAPFAFGRKVGGEEETEEEIYLSPEGA